MFVCHRLQSNAYRILGVTAASTSPQVHNAAVALRRSAMLGIVATELDCLGEIIQTEAAIRSALGTLSNPRERIQHRLLWFHGLFCFENSLCIGPWPKFEPRQASHESALRALTAAYLSEDLPQILSALRDWHGFSEENEYWQFLAESESQAGFEPAAIDSEIQALRENAMALAAEPLVAAARAAWAQGAIQLFREYLAAFRQLEETGPWAAACRESLLFPLIRRLADAGTTVQDKYRSQVVRGNDAAVFNRTVCAAELHYFRQYVETAWKDIAVVLAEGDTEAYLARSQAADLLHLIALDHTWADEQVAAEELAVEAVDLAKGTAAEERIRQALAKYLLSREKRLRREAYSLAAGALDDAVRVFNTHFPLDEIAGETCEQCVAISAAALKFYRNSIEPLLKQLLAEFARDQEGCGDYRASGAQCLSMIANTLARVEEFAQADELLCEALALTEGTRQVSCLHENLVRIRELSEKTRAYKANEAAALETLKLASQHCRTLANWGAKVVEEAGHTRQNLLIANEELVFFRSHLDPALHNAVHLLTWTDLRVSLLRAEAGHLLAEIAIHHSWAGEVETANTLFVEALQLAEENEAAITIKQNYHSRRCTAPPRETSGTSKRRAAESLTPKPNHRVDQFPKKLPLFRGELWRMGAALTVLVVLILACLADSDGGSVSAEITPPSQVPSTQLVLPLLRSLPPN